MIERIERSPDRLRIESRARFGRQAILSIVVTGLLVAGAFAAVFLGFAWMQRAAGIEVESRPTAPIGIIVFGAVAMITIAGFVWMRALSETLTAEGENVTYERYVGLFRVWHADYDLLRMRGLRRDLSLSSQDVKPPHGGSDADASVAYPLPLEWKTHPARPTMAVWYDDEPFVFGYSLSPDDVTLVESELLAYERGLRSAVGLDPGLGLEDLSVWTQTRTLTLGPLWMDPSFRGGIFGRKSDFDR